MPFYLYSAVDPAGKKLEGTIEATTAGEAIHLLNGRGMHAPRILAERGASAPASSRPAPASSPPAARVQPIQPLNPPRPRTGQPAPSFQINAPAPPLPKAHHTKKSTDKDLFFLFAQISDQLRAGINPVQTFGELSRMYKDPKYHQSLAMVADAASEGKSISSVLAKWPDLYPEHIVGLTKAGEMGGFLPEAMATISEQAGNAYKFKRFHWWVWLLAINALLSIPLVFMFRHSLLAYIDQLNATGGQNPGGMFAMFIVMGRMILWPWGPATLALCALCWILRNYLSTRQMRKFRHEVGLKMPVLGSRARNESVTIFTWVLGKLAKGGVAPNRSWELAVGSVPNIAMQERLQQAGVFANEGSRLSDIVFKSNLFPQEYAPSIATGEMTGDITGALDRLTNVSRTEYEAGTMKSKMFTGSLGCTALIITTGIAAIVITWALSHDLIGKFIDQADNPTSSGSNLGLDQ